MNWDSSTISAQDIQSMQTRMENLGIRRTILQLPGLRNLRHISDILKLSSLNEQETCLDTKGVSKTLMFHTEKAQQTMTDTVYHTSNVHIVFSIR